MNSAPNLHDLQHWLKWIITDPRGVREALSNSDPGIAENNDRYTQPTGSKLEWIVGGTIPATTRLDVYAEGYFLRILECLSKDFPKTKDALGDQVFSRLVAQYLKVHPSRFTSIDEVGRYFAEFLASAHEGLPFGWIRDLARLEWMQIEAFYAIEPQIMPDWFKKIDEFDGLSFEVHSSVRLLESKWCLPAIIEDLSTQSLSQDPSTYLGSSFFLVYRHDDFYCWEELTGAMYEVIRRIQTGCNLAEATEHLDDEDAPNLSRAFSHWVDRSILCGTKKENE